MNIESIMATALDGRTKGIPGNAAPFALRDIASKNWNVLREDMPLPLMVLKRSCLDHNSRVFGEYLTANGLSFAPHGKTTMSPQLFAEQLRDGAWAITAATVNQVQVMRSFGVQRIVLANQLVGRQHVGYIAAELNRDPTFDFYCFVDSIAQLRNIEHHLSGVSLARPIKVLIEAGAPGGRTGVRSLDAARVLAAALLASDTKNFRFVGVAAFEGAVPGLATSTAPVDALSEFVLDIVRALPAELVRRADEFILSAGGSSYFDIVAQHFKAAALDVPVRVLLRSGCYLTHDHGAYEAAHQVALHDPHRHTTGDLLPALEAWGYVQSVPEPGLGFLTMGKRDIPFDSGFPVPIKRYRPGVGFLPVGQSEMFATNDQHAFVRLGADADWQIGDLVACGISHPCTAFDKWRFIPVVNDDYDVIDGVLTYF